MRALLRTAAAAFALAAAGAAPAGAATVVGSPLTNADGSSGSCSGPNGVCTQWNTALPGATLSVPADGVVTVFRVRTARAIRARLRVLRGPASATTVVASSPFAAFSGTNVAVGLDVRLPVRAGDVLALGIAAGDNVPYAITGGSSGACFNPMQPEPADGSTQPAQTFCSGGEELLYNGGVEADADGDGFGDETQDRCLGSAGSDGGCPLPSPPPLPPPPPPAPDGPPVVTGLSVSNPVFRVDAAAQAAGRDPTPRGTRFRFELSEAATVTFAIERRASGRSVNGRCRRPTARNRTRRACVRWVHERTFRRALSGGAADVRFSGRVRTRRGARSLRPARYRVTLQARDAAGNAALAAPHVGFRIID